MMANYINRVFNILMSSLGCEIHTTWGQWSWSWSSHVARS